MTGSCHIVRTNGRTILLDCGLFQGQRGGVRRKNLTLPEDPDAIDAIVLSHAHIDHAGRLPFLVNRGYRHPIHTTAATRDLCEVMLADAAHIQEKDAKFLSRRNREHFDPLYSNRDVHRTMELMVGARYNRVVEVVPGVRATFVDAGHILGSASVILDCADGTKTTRLVFSGDIGRKGLAIIGDPVIPTGADAVLMESTYGNRDHASVEGAKSELARVVRETSMRGGKVLIPAFAVGRTQELVFALHELADQGAIPRIPIYIDSPLAIRATAVFERHRDLFDDSERFVRAHHAAGEGPFKFPMLTYTQSVEASKELDQHPGPMIIIAASGMAESGRIVHHLLHGASDPRNTVLVVGFMAEHTMGRRIIERQPFLKLFGEDVALRARIEVINGYSAHADRAELFAWIAAVREQSPALRGVWLVHGETDAQDALASTINTAGLYTHAPAAGDHVRV